VKKEQVQLLKDHLDLIRTRNKRTRTEEEKEEDFELATKCRALKRYKTEKQEKVDLEDEDIV